MMIFQAALKLSQKQALTTRKEEFKFPCIEVIVYIRISDASFLPR